MPAFVSAARGLSYKHAQSWFLPVFHRCSRKEPCTRGDPAVSGARSDPALQVLPSLWVRAVSAFLSLTGRVSGGLRTFSVKAQRVKF